MIFQHHLYILLKKQGQALMFIRWAGPIGLRIRARHAEKPPEPRSFSDKVKGVYQRFRIEFIRIKFIRVESEQQFDIQIPDPEAVTRGMDRMSLHPVLNVSIHPAELRSPRPRPSLPLHPDIAVFSAPPG